MYVYYRPMPFRFSIYVAPVQRPRCQRIVEPQVFLQEFSVSLMIYSTPPTCSPGFGRAIELLGLWNHMLLTLFCV